MQPNSTHDFSSNNTLVTSPEQAKAGCSISYMGSGCTGRRPPHPGSSTHLLLVNLPQLCLLLSRFNLNRIHSNTKMFKCGGLHWNPSSETVWHFRKMEKWLEDNPCTLSSSGEAFAGLRLEGVTVTYTGRRRCARKSRCNTHSTQPRYSNELLLVLEMGKRDQGQKRHLGNEKN